MKVCFLNLTSGPIDIYEIRTEDGNHRTEAIQVAPSNYVKIATSLGTSFSFWNKKGQRAIANYQVFDNNNNNNDDDDDKVADSAQRSKDCFQLSWRFRVTPEVLPRPSFANFYNRNPSIVVHLHHAVDSIDSLLRDPLDDPLEERLTATGCCEFTIHNRSDSVVSVFDSPFGRHYGMIHWRIEPRSELTLRASTHNNRPMYFVDEDGEPMQVTWDGMEASMGEEVVDGEDSPVMLIPPPRPLCRQFNVEVRQNIHSLQEMAIRVLKRHRRPNGREWSQEKVPRQFLGRLDGHGAVEKMNFLTPERAERLRKLNDRRWCSLPAGCELHARDIVMDDALSSLDSLTSRLSLLKTPVLVLVAIAFAAFVVQGYLSSGVARTAVVH